MQLYEIEFLKQQGKKTWLQGLENIPAKLRALCEINKILAHQPWLLSASHIEVSEQCAFFASSEFRFIYLASPNKQTTHIHKIIRQGDHYSLANNSRAKN